jgi:protein-S-isoprenylcysteine O-methyltransferase Ste14
MRHVVYDITSAATWIGWGALGLVWAAGALWAGRGGAEPVLRREARDLASRLGGVVAVIVVVTPQSVWRPLTVGWPAARAAGLALFVLATAATIWARLALGTMWSSGATTRTNRGLRTTGPYAITRHPIYTCVLAMLGATALMQCLGRWVALFVLVVGVLLIKVGSEERLLVDEFGAEYARYQRRVPRLIPTLRRARRR